jgi:hypothetical protein
MPLEPPTVQEDAGHLHPHSTSSIHESHPHGSKGLPITALEIGVIVGTVLAFAAGLFFVFYCRQSDRSQNNDNNNEAGGGSAEEDSSQRNADEQGEELTVQSPKPHESTHWYMSVVQKLGR